MFYPLAHPDLTVATLSYFSPRMFHQHAILTLIGGMHILLPN